MSGDDSAELTKERSSRLRDESFSRGMLSSEQCSSSPETALKIPKALLNHSGHSIVRKSTRGKRQYLLVLPGRIQVAVSANQATLGTLSHMDTPNPILYIDFPNGRLKMFGTLVYPENKYFAVQYSASAKTMPTFAGTFECLLVMSRYQWIGDGSDGSEAALPFPKDVFADTTPEEASKFATRGDFVPKDAQHKVWQPIIGASSSSSTATTANSNAKPPMAPPRNPVVAPSSSSRKRPSNAVAVASSSSKRLRRTSSLSSVASSESEENVVAEAEDDAEIVIIDAQDEPSNATKNKKKNTPVKVLDLTMLEDDDDSYNADENKPLVSLSQAGDGSDSNEREMSQLQSELCAIDAEMEALFDSS